MEDKKLLCAFVYAAYESGYCGLSFDDEIRKKHMNRFLEYVTGERHFPKKEIDKTPNKLGNIVDSNSIREHVYGGHILLVKKKVEEESGQSFEKAVENPFFRNIATLCVVRLYEVVGVEKDYVSVKDDFLNETKKLKRIGEIEKPTVGDIVSGHWSCMLEVAGGEQLAKYKPLLGQYLNKLKRRA